METWGIIIATVSALAGIVAAVVAVVQAAAARQDRKDAEAARNESRTARDEAVRLSREANDAFKRQAEAQEKANEIELAKLPTPQVEWTIRNGGNRDSRIVVNTGDIEARNVVATGSNGVQTDDDSSSDSVMPGDSVEFYILRTFDDAGRPRLHLEWDDDTRDERYVIDQAVQ
jgi:hypothetical protein